MAILQIRLGNNSGDNASDLSCLQMVEEKALLASTSEALEVETGKKKPALPKKQRAGSSMASCACLPSYMQAFLHP